MASPGPSERTAFTTPTLLSLKELEETTNATFATTISNPPSTWLPSNTPYYIRTALLLLVTATSATVAFSGVVVLGYLLATHSLTPRQLWYSSPLQLDLAGRELVSVASMLPLTQSGMTTPSSSASVDPGSKLDLNSRFLPSGQRMDVWIDFIVPALGDGTREAGELAYVVADLESVDHRVATRSTQPVLLKSHSATLWRLLAAPLHWTGLLSDARVVSLKVFSNYIERRDIPFAAFKLTIKSRGESSPKVLSATVRVHLRVGLLRRILYHLRPHSLIALSMGAGAVCAIVGGSIGAGLCIAVLVYTIIIRSRPEEGEATPTAEGRRRLGSIDSSSLTGGSPSSFGGDLSSDTGSDLLAGMSSAGTTPRQLDLSEEEEAGAGGSSPLAAGAGTPSVSPAPSSPSPSPRAEKSWQMLLKQIPFPSPQNSSGRTELGAAGLRFRKGDGDGAKTGFA